MLQPAIRLICRTEGALDPGANAPLSIHCRTRLTTPSDRFMRFSLDPRHLLRARHLRQREDKMTTDADNNADSATRGASRRLSRAAVSRRRFVKAAVAGAGALATAGRAGWAQS